ncbi:unnamed protein product [Pleuronectes platessa]|uniref:Uncharacterized protein n=1 Tax=Pleuronectes platessa TaxID=8262 RepID=A0A9N7TTZ9_PLEPL|nr:unnamed protein product [Pleuronectes platessa]
MVKQGDSLNKASNMEENMELLIVQNPELQEPPLTTAKAKCRFKEEGEKIFTKPESAARSSVKCAENNEPSQKNLSQSPTHHQSPSPSNTYPKDLTHRSPCSDLMRSPKLIMSRKCQVQLLSNLWRAVRGDASIMEDGSCCCCCNRKTHMMCESHLVRVWSRAWLG